MSASATAASATAFSATTSAAVPVTATALAAADERAKPEAEGKPVEDDRRLIDRRRDLIDRRGIDGRCAWVALSVGRIIISGGANRGLRIGRNGAGPCPENQANEDGHESILHGMGSPARHQINRIPAFAA
jgi:hypothetical protein